MEKEAILAKLNWFYSLELSQVDLYMAQSKRVDEIYLSKVLERTSYIEQQHVDNIAAQIKKMGGTPTVLGDVIAPLVGKTGGNITTGLGLVPMLKANVLLEQKAVSDYKDFLLKAGKDPELFSLLWANLIDEDLHTAWFLHKIHALEAQRQEK